MRWQIWDLDVEEKAKWASFVIGILIGSVIIIFFSYDYSRTADELKKQNDPAWKKQAAIASVLGILSLFCLVGGIYTFLGVVSKVSMPTWKKIQAPTSSVQIK